MVRGKREKGFVWNSSAVTRPEEDECVHAAGPRDILTEHGATCDDRCLSDHWRLLSILCQHGFTECPALDVHVQRVGRGAECSALAFIAFRHNSSQPLKGEETLTFPSVAVILST